MSNLQRPVFGWPIIGTQNLYLRVGKRTLVDQLDWQVRSGERWCVIGRNGAGKSTLLRALAGLRQPDAGCIQIEGRNLSDWPLPDLARSRAFLSQARNDAFGYCAIETVLAARHPYHAGRGWESNDDLQAANEALAALDVADLDMRDVRTLSGGERQRVAIAALLAQDAPLMLLDEPTSALDLAHQVGVTTLLSRLCREHGKTIVMAGHDLNLAHGLATHALLLMGEGEWRAGTVAEVMTAELLGQCFGYPVEVIMHGDRTIFLPVMNPSKE